LSVIDDSSWREGFRVSSGISSAGVHHPRGDLSAGDAFQRSGARAKTSILLRYKTWSKRRRAARHIRLRMPLRRLDDVVLRISRRVWPTTSVAWLCARWKRLWLVFVAIWLVRKGLGSFPRRAWTDRLDAKYLRPWHASDLQTVWTDVVPAPNSYPTWSIRCGTLSTLTPNKEIAFSTPLAIRGRVERGETRLGEEVWL